MSAGAWRRPYDAARAAPSFVDAWPAAWVALAPPFELIPLTPDQARALGHHTLGCSAWFTPCSAAPLGALAQQIDAAIARLGGACFVRLNSRSPKDSLRAQRCGLCVRRGHEALALFLEGSQRCAADLRMALDDGRTACLVVRAWLPMRAEREFRCLMAGRRWAGASQARVDPSTVGAAALAETAALMPSMLRALQVTMSALCEASTMPDAIFDLAVIDSPSGHHAFLLDANPWLDETDLGGFGECSGAMPRALAVYHAGEGGIAAMPLPASARDAGR